MAKTIVKPGIRKTGSDTEHIVKVQFDDSEPPKNYVWVHPDGFIKIWKNGKWVNVFERCGNHHADLEDYVTKDSFNQRLKEMKTEVLTFLVKSLNNVSGSDEALTKYVKEYLEPKLDEVVNSSTEQENTNITVNSRLNELESIDHSKFLTQHQSLANYYKKSDVQNLYVSKEGLATSVSEAGFLKADANTISDLENNVSNLQTGVSTINGEITTINSKVNVINGKITNINTEISEIKETMEDDKADVTVSLNNLDNRLKPLEQIDHSIYITAEDI